MAARGSATTPTTLVGWFPLSFRLPNSSPHEMEIIDRHTLNPNCPGAMECNFAKRGCFWQGAGADGEGEGVQAVTGEGCARVY